MRKLLAVCDEFADKFDVMFNASKSKCMLFRPRKSSKYAAVGTPDLSIGGNLYLKIGRLVRLQSEGRTAGMPVMSQCQPLSLIHI